MALVGTGDYMIVAVAGIENQVEAAIGLDSGVEDSVPGCEDSTAA
jgi:hypothetical protein